MTSIGAPVFAEYAVAYATHLGLGVFPCRPRGKRPEGSLAPHGVNSASRDPDIIREWARQCPDANIGLAVPPGVVVLDLDSEHVLHVLHAEGKALPTTWTAKTAKGVHLWFSLPDGVTAQNSVRILPDVDT